MRPDSGQGTDRYGSEPPESEGEMAKTLDLYIAGEGTPGTGDTHHRLIDRKRPCPTRRSSGLTGYRSVWFGAARIRRRDGQDTRSVHRRRGDARDGRHPSPPDRPEETMPYTTLFRSDRVPIGMVRSRPNPKERWPRHSICTSPESGRPGRETPITA